MNLPGQMPIARGEGGAGTFAADSYLAHLDADQRFAQRSHD
jgi:hypothetical protein